MGMQTYRQTHRQTYRHTDARDHNTFRVVCDVDDINNETVKRITIGK